MLNTTLPPMRPELVVCPNSVCDASGRIGVHSLKERRYICHACGKTFAETRGTPLFGLKHPLWLVGVVLGRICKVFCFLHQEAKNVDFVPDGASSAL